ncbi:MAG: GNAT family N-acetyltransferase [Pseudomonadota bacterium]
MNVLHTNAKGYQFYPLQKSFLGAINVLGDQIFGDDYLLQIGLEDDWEKIAQLLHPVSMVVAKESHICAVRISYPPGQWGHLMAYKKSHPELWPSPSEQVAYFKLSMVHPDHRNQGLGREMANLAVGSLKSLGAKGVVTHSWNESPGGSSAGYVNKLGFHKIAEIPGFWAEYIYSCLECNQDPCECTASEMYLAI